MSLSDAIYQHGLGLAARFAAITGELVLIEAVRADGLAAINAKADSQAAPLLSDAAKVRGELEIWWSANGDALTLGKRQTVEMGGCMIGTKGVRASLAIPGDGVAGLEALKGARWAKPFVTVSYAVDKVAVLKALDGKHGANLSALGYLAATPPPSFVLKRVEQSGVVG